MLRMLYTIIFVQILCVFGLSLARPQIPNTMATVANIGYSHIGYTNRYRCYDPHILRIMARVPYDRHYYSRYCNINYNPAYRGIYGGYNNLNSFHIGQHAAYNGYGSTGITQNNNVNLINIGQLGGYNGYGGIGSNPTINQLSTYVSNTNVNSYVDASNNFYGGNSASLVNSNRDNTGLYNDHNTQLFSDGNEGFISNDNTGFVNSDNTGLVSSDNAGLFNGDNTGFVSDGNEGFSSSDNAGFVDSDNTGKVFTSDNSGLVSRDNYDSGDNAGVYSDDNTGLISDNTEYVNGDNPEFMGDSPDSDSENYDSAPVSNDDSDQGDTVKNEEVSE